MEYGAHHIEVINMQDPASKKVAVASAALMLTAAGALVSPHTSQAAPVQPNTQAGDCSLIQEPLAVQGAAPHARTDLFASYGDTSGSWVGGDSTYSVELKDGTTAWLFSDTVLGTVVDGAVDEDTMGFINNSAVLEQDGVLTKTVSGWGDEGREALFPPPAEDAWYWLGAGYPAPNGDLHIGLNRYDRFGPGLWDWAWNHTAIATVDSKTWQVKHIRPAAGDSPVQWTSWYERAEGKTYVYGVHDQGDLKQAHVARVAGHDVSRVDKWEYWTGTKWSRDAADSAPILDHVANEYSVTKFRDGYLFLTQDTSESFSTKVVAYTSCSPTGPFVQQVELFDTPETGEEGSYGDPNIYTYNAHVHPHLSDDGSLVVSYNVNTFDDEHIFDDVTIYRPRFWAVTLS